MKRNLRPDERLFLECIRSNGCMTGKAIKEQTGITDGELHSYLIRLAYYGNIECCGRSKGTKSKVWRCV